MQYAIERKATGRFRLPQEYEELDGGMVLAHSEWDVPEGGSESRHIVLTLREGRIADMQGFATRREALRFARRRRSSAP